MARYPANPRSAQTQFLADALLFTQRRVTKAIRLLPTDGVLLADATARALNILLPPARELAGRAFLVKKVDATANIVTLAAVFGDLIDGARTLTLISQYEAVTVVSDGTNRYAIISRVPGTTSGTGGAAGTVHREVPTGTRPGTLFALGFVPVAGSELVRLNNLWQQPVVAAPGVNQYTLSGTTLTMGMSIQASDDLQVVYWT